MELEIWKDIPGYGGEYKISNLGNIKSLKYGKERMLKPIKESVGYIVTHLTKKSKGKFYKVHRLIALLFIPNPENKPNINHINGIKTDNRIDNLEWCTQGENCKHAYNTGLNKVSKNHHFYTNHPSLGKFGREHFNSIEINQYDLEGNFIRLWHSASDIRRDLGIHNISACCKGRLKTSGGYIWKYNI